MANIARGFGVQADVLRQDLGRVGVWHIAIGLEPASVERDFAARVEDLGYGGLWFGESPRTKEAFSHAAILLQATRRVTVATGIASIWARDAAASVAAAAALADAYDGRFLLGLGVSNRLSVAARGGEFAKPFTEMRRYLDAMDRPPYNGPVPPGGITRVLAALRPRMLELARDRAAGAHPYFVPTEHTARARQILGPRAFLAPEHAFVVEEDPERARALGRSYATYYLRRTSYTNNLRELGFTDDEFVDGGSDRLIDAVVAWGDVETVTRKIRAHLEAGADHVCIQPLGPVQHAADQLAAVAPGLGVTPR